VGDFRLILTTGNNIEVSWNWGKWKYSTPANERLAEELYIKHCCSVCAQMHFAVCKEMAVNFETESWYERSAKSLQTSPESKF
jgi:hypothetical protein